MKRKQEPAELTEVTLLHVTCGREYYTALGRSAPKRSGVYEAGADYWYERETHKRDITSATKQLFEQARERFYRTVERAERGLDGYFAVVTKGCCVAYQRWQDAERGYARMGPNYSFVLRCENYTRIFPRISVYEFFEKFILPSDSPQEEKQRLEEMYELFMDPRTNGGDRYLACAFKECCRKMTREDADFLCADDSVYRFIPEDKRYDTDDMEVLEVKNGKYTWLSCRSVNFVLKVAIDGRKYEAFWRPSDPKYAVMNFHIGGADSNKLTICSKMFYRQIAISNAIKKRHRPFRRAVFP